MDLIYLKMICSNANCVQKFCVKLKAANVKAKTLCNIKYVWYVKELIC